MTTHFKIEAIAKDNKGSIRIVDTISMFTDSNASKIRDIVDDYLKRGITTATVYINSRGGSVIEATEIVNELKRIPKINVIIGTLAVSAATYIAAHFYTRAYANSQLMIHRPTTKVSGDVNQIKSDLKMLENINQDYKQVYATKMNKTLEEIEAIFNKGDYWMTAAEALELGLIDEIINSDSQISAEDIERLTACGAPTIPVIAAIKTEDKKQEIKTKKTMENRNKTISLLKLSADATDEQIQDALEKTIEKAAQVDALTALQQKDRAVAVSAMVDKAITDKKITADVKDKFEQLAMADFESTQAVLESMPGALKVSAALEHEKTNANAKDKWTMNDYLDKDPQALDKIALNEPEKFARLEAEYFSQKND